VKKEKGKKRLHTAVTTLSGEPNFPIRKKKNQFKLFFSTSENKTKKKEIMYHLLRIIFIVRHTGR
jgi:hypothetical protein